MKNQIIKKESAKNPYILRISSTFYVALLEICNIVDNINALVK